MTLIVGGSRGMSGAIALAGMAALRSGAGLVRLAVPDVCLETVAGFEPSYMTVALPGDREGRLQVQAKDRLSELASAASALACGPGMGRSQQLTDLTSWMYEVLPQPMVVDADALFALAECAERLSEPGGPRVLHPIRASSAASWPRTTHRARPWRRWLAPRQPNGRPWSCSKGTVRW